MLEVADARQKISQLATPIVATETVPLASALGRYAAMDTKALEATPPQDNSAMDGYAIRTSDLKVTTRLPISQTIPAGLSPGPLTPGTAARIFTGAVIPEGADTVVMLENCDATEHQVTVRQLPNPNENIRLRGHDLARNATIILRGQRFQSSHLAALAATGHDSAEVICAPQIVILNTGSELLEPGTPLTPGKIYNSNHILLSSMLQQWGCAIIHTATIPDSFSATTEALSYWADKAHCIITSGGVSVGDEDHVKRAVETTGELSEWKVRMKPGKPLAFGHIHATQRKTPIICVPGNPVSACVSAWLFLKTFIHALHGGTLEELNFHQGIAQFSIHSERKRPEFARGVVRDGHASLLPNQSSGALSSLTQANALIFIDSGLTFEQGGRVPYLPIDSFFF